jgi:uncharacterized phage protein gp47/JayE
MATVIVDYTSKDYDGFRTSLLDYATTAYPEWTPGSVADFGVMMVEAFAYMGDILSYYGDRAAAEAYIGTATKRQSVLNLAEVLGYLPRGRTNSSGTITLTNADAADFDVVAGTQFLTGYNTERDAPIIFEVDTTTTVPGSGSVAVPVSEGETRTGEIISVLGVDEQLLQIGVTDGTEYQEFVIPDVPIIDSTVRLFIDVSVVVSGGDTVEEYRVEPRILDATPYDKSFELNKDGDGVVVVNLGDGINGFLPPADLRVWAAYRIGGGDEGNVEANSIIAFAGPAGDLSITSSTEMTGGTEEETTEQIRVNAPRAYRTQNRAVTLQDYEDIALGVQGVGKANAVANSATSITIWVLGSQGVVASTALKTLVRQTIMPLALAGSDVTVANASLVPIDLGGPTTGDEVLIGVNERYVQAAVSAAVEDILLAYLSPDNRSFGERLNVSSLYSLIRTVPGVDYVTIPVMIRQDVTPAVTTADIILNEWEIATAGNFIFAPEGGIE